MPRNPAIHIDNTRFIFQTNLSGDPERDTYGSSDRKVNIVIPNPDQARELAETGFNVKATKPKAGEEEGFVPTFFVVAKANYDSEWPPKIYLVTGNSDPVLLDADTVGQIDKVYVTNVRVTLNPYFSQRNNKWSLYIKTMYVEQDVDDDPYASYYAARKQVRDEYEGIPFN